MRIFWKCQKVKTYSSVVICLLVVAYTLRFIIVLPLNVRNSSLDDTPSMLASSRSGDQGQGHGLVHVVHAVWCGGQFTFTNYISVLSVAKQLAPHVIYFYSHHPPDDGPHHYNQWFQRLKNQLPFFTVVTSPFTCLPVAPTRASFSSPSAAAARVNNTLISQLVHGMKLVPQSVQVLMINPRFIVLPTLQATVNFDVFTDASDVSTEDCSMQLSSNRVIHTISCSDGELGQFCSCLPIGLRLRNLMKDSNWSLVPAIRELVYGQRKVPQPIRRVDIPPIPRVAHYVILGQYQPINIVFYLSLLSVLFVAKVTCVYVHGDMEPRGALWEDVRQRGCVTWHYRPPVSTIWQRSVTHVKHCADVIRSDVMLTHGGLHLDPDVLIGRPLPEGHWQYDAVLATDSYSGAPGNDIPEDIAPLVSLGFCLGRAGAEFFRLYRESQRDYRDEHWVYNSGVKPLHIVEERPHVALVDPKLQVVCANYRCVPSWAHNTSHALALARQPMAWIDTVTSLHISWPIPDELRQPRSLAKSRSVFAYIARKILAAAQLPTDHVVKLLAN